MVLKNQSFDTYTLKLQARKTAGTNAFIIPFAVADQNNMLRAHIGSYVNANTVFEIVSDGSVSNISTSKRLRTPIITGVWYDIRLEVGLNQVDCYLNDTLLMSYSEPRKIFGLAGKDQKSGDLIIKMVNGSESEYATDFLLEGDEQVNGSITAYTIQAESVRAENSFTHPKEFVPVKSSSAKVSGKNFAYRFQKNSITVLRIPVKK